MHALSAFAGPAARIVVATLFNSLWEGALLALAVWALLTVLPNINATTRYAAWWIALAASLVLPIVTALPQISVQHMVMTRVVTTTAAPRHTVVAPPAKITANVAQQSPTTPAAVPTQTVAAPISLRLRFALPQAAAIAIFAAWIAAALFLLIRLAFNLYRLESLKRDALPFSLDYREQLARWKAAEKGFRDVRLCVSDHIEVPVAVGLFDSMVLVPKHLLETLSDKEIDQITLHELAHLRRADDWTNGIQRIIQAIFFFNPAVLFMAQQLDLEREVACDDWVLRQTGDVRPYATCLTRMAEVTAWPHRALAAPGVFVTRRGLSIRVERLLRAGRNVRTSISFGPAGAVATTLIVMFFLAQNVAPSFAFTLPSGSGHSVAGSATAWHAGSPQKTVSKLNPSTQATAPATKVVYRDRYRDRFIKEAATTVGSLAVSATPTPAPRHLRRIYRPGYGPVYVNVPPVHVNVPPVDVRVPEVNVRVPEMHVNVPAVNVHVPAVHVRIPSYDYSYKGYSFKNAAKRYSFVSGENCIGCDFSGVSWAGRNLQRISLTGSNFSNADLHGANFSYSNLSGIDFTGANLRNANFSYANLEGCSLRRADLTGAIFTGAHLSGCDIDVSRLEPAQARSLLTGCEGCNFRSADLRNQDLRGVAISGDDFSYADLRGADMRNGSFNGVDFKHARFDGARLDGAQFSGCDFTDVDLRKVDLSHTQIVGSKITNMR